MFSQGSTNTRGVASAVLIRCGLDIVIQHKYSDSKGWLITLNINITL